MQWCFAVINNKLAEVFFEKKGGEVRFIGHCYVQRDEYKTKCEQKWIAQETARLKFLYRSGKYKRITV